VFKFINESIINQVRASTTDPTDEKKKKMKKDEEGWGMRTLLRWAMVQSLVGLIRGCVMMHPAGELIAYFRFLIPPSPILNS